MTPKKAAAMAAVHPDPAKAKAITHFRSMGVVAYACAAAGVSRGTWYRWASTDETFAVLAREAEEHVADMLERAAMKRATAKEGSDTLLIFLLKARRPEKYRERQTITLLSPEVQAAVKQTIDLIASKASWDSAELLDRLDTFWR